MKRIEERTPGKCQTWPTPDCFTASCFRNAPHFALIFRSNMDVTWFLFLTAAIFVTVILMAAVCLDCRNHGPPESIPQVNPTGEYMLSPEFRLIHPVQAQPVLRWSSTNAAPKVLSPNSSNHGSQQRRLSSYMSAETVEGDQKSNADDYIIVLPQKENSPDAQSLASTSSSNIPYYVNVDGGELLGPDPALSLSESNSYENVELSPACETPKLSYQSDSDDEEANYVNQPPLEPDEPDDQ